MPLSRAYLAAAGGAVLAAAWLGPLPAAAHAHFSAHMLIHMLVVALAAPLVAAGLTPGLGGLLRRWPALGLAGFASLLDMVVIWAWHTPRLHFAARTDGLAFATEQASFLAVALLVWVAAFGAAAHGPRGGALAGAAALFFTSMHMTLLGVLIGLAQSPICAIGGGGLDAMLADQQAGAALMLGAGGISYLVGGLVLVAQVLRAPAPRKGCAL